jgi:hypothetical protein
MPSFNADNVGRQPEFKNSERRSQGACDIKRRGAFVSCRSKAPVTRQFL